MDPLKQLSAALRAERDGGRPNGDESQGDDDEGDDDNGAPPQKKPKPKKPKALKDLAESTGLSEADLYAIEIPASQQGAEPLTLGKLKDLAAQEGDLTVRGLKLDEDRRTFEARKTGQEQLFNELLAQLPADAIKPEAMEKLKGMIDKRRGEDRARMLEQIPEFADEKVRAAEIKEIVGHLEGYGIPGAFLAQNPQLMRWARDSWKQATMIRKALEQVEERKPKTPGRGPQNDGGKREKSSGGHQTRQQRQVGGFMNIINSHGKR